MWDARCRPASKGMPVPQESTEAPEPQPVLSPLTAAAVFLVLTIEPGGEDAVRDLLGDVTALQRSVGFRTPGRGAAGGRRDRLGRLGPAVRRPAPGRAASLPRASRASPPGPGHAGRPALPHPGEPDGPLLRVHHPGDGAAGGRGHGRRRGARLPLLRRAGPDRLRRRHRVALGLGRGQGRDRRSGRRPGLRRRQLRDHPEVPARPARLERDQRRGAGARDRPHASWTTSRCRTTSSRSTRTSRSTR